MFVFWPCFDVCHFDLVLMCAVLPLILYGYYMLIVLHCVCMIWTWVVCLSFCSVLYVYTSLPCILCLSFCLRYMSVFFYSADRGCDLHPAVYRKVSQLEKPGDQFDGHPCVGWRHHWRRRGWSATGENQYKADPNVIWVVFLHTLGIEIFKLQYQQQNQSICYSVYM